MCPLDSPLELRQNLLDSLGPSKSASCLTGVYPVRLFRAAHMGSCALPAGRATSADSVQLLVEADAAINNHAAACAHVWWA